MRTKVKRKRAKRDARYWRRMYNERDAALEDACDEFRAEIEKRNEEIHRIRRERDEAYGARGQAEEKERLAREARDKTTVAQIEELNRMHRARELELLKTIERLAKRLP